MEEEPLWLADFKSEVKNWVKKNFMNTAFEVMNDKKESSNVKLVLCLDGGGVKGTMTISFLVELEKMMGKPIAKIFDLIAGTSTGAIQAGLLAGMGFTAKKAQSFCTKRVFERIFPTIAFSKGGGAIGVRYDGEGKANLCKELYGDKKLGDVAVPILIPYYDLNKSEALCINDIDHAGKLLREVVDASSAAPTFFPPVQITSHDGKDTFCVDGGLFANDPSLCAYLDAKQRWPDHDIRLLSIGTGTDRKAYDKSCRTWGEIEWLTKHDLVGLMLDTTVTQKQVAALLGINYVRINADLKIGECSPDLDCISESNVEALKTLGSAMFAQSGWKAVNLIVRDTVMDRGKRRLGEPLDPHSVSKIHMFDGKIVDTQ